MKKIHKVTKYVHSPERAMEWYEYMMAYIKASTYLAREYKQHEDQTSDKILLPLLFNVRHCIELLLKFFTYGTPEQPQYTHDISSIFERFQATFEKLDKPQLLLLARHLQLPHAVMENAQEYSMHHLEKIIDKYHEYTFLGSGEFLIEDPKNETFRYPVSFNNDFKIDLENLHTKIFADEIIEDLEFLFFQALTFMYTFTVTPEGIPIFEALQEWANQESKEH